MHTDADEVEAPLVASGPGEIRAKDIDLPAGVEILNPRRRSTLEKRTKLEMYLTIGRGRGYSPAEENKTEDQPIGVIPIDSISRRSARRYDVDSARVGQRTDFDKLTLEVETDGSLEPGSALREAAEILIRRWRSSPTRTASRSSPAAMAPTGPRALSPAAPSEGDERLIEELEIGVGPTTA